MSITLKKIKDAKPIAIIKSGKYNNQIIYLTKSKVDNDEFNFNIDYDFLDILFKKYKVKPRDRVVYTEKLKKLLKEENKHFITDDEILKNIFDEIVNNKKETTELKLIDGEFLILPDKDFRMYIAGKTKCGKSYISGNVARQYKRMYKDNDVYLISKVENDEAYKNIDYHKVNFSNYIEEPPESISEEFGSNCLLIFDDIDTIDGKMGKIIQNMINQACQMGRHNNISVIICTHYLTNYAKSAIQLSECEYYVVYPKGTTEKKLNYMLSTYGDIDDKYLKDIRKMGRWVLISRDQITYPSYLISENKIKILDEN